MIDVQHILLKARSAKILVVGDVMLDVYDFCYTDHSRPSPEREGTLVYTAHRTEKMLGGAGNVAANLTSLGAGVSLIAIGGDDGNGYEVRALCEQAGIAHSLICDDTRSTTVKTRLYIDDQYHLRRDDEDIHKINPDVARSVRDAFISSLDGVDAVILSDYNKGFFTADLSREIIDLCIGKGILVVVDFKPPNRAFFNKATIVVPNKVEAMELVPGFSLEDPLPGLMALHDMLSAENVMVTLGAQGIVVFDGKRMEWINGRDVQAIDPCGCGDTVRACLTLGLVAGHSLVEAAEFANHAASLAVQKLGTATLSPEELGFR